MAVEICPRCMSLMMNGLCSNKSCNNSALEIEFIDKIKTIFSDLPKRYYGLVNNSFDLDLGVKNEVTYDKEETKIHAGLHLIKYLKKYKMNNIKTISYAKGSKDILVELVRYIEPSEADWKVKKLKKHYISYQLICSEGDTLFKPIIIGSDDYEIWEDVGYYPAHKEDWKRIKNIIGIGYYQLNNWTLGITNNSTGIELKTYFSKEKVYKLFSDREIKEGRVRRSALQHKVPEFEKYGDVVEEFLRGVNTFKWHQLTLNIHPPIREIK